MPFAIRADPLLGTYRGHRPDLTPERFPSVARLHAALLSAAGFGPRAVQVDDGWAPCDADDLALRWLEENPPTEVQVPRLQVSLSDAIAYRDDGTIGKSGKATVIRKLGKQDGVVAVDGPFVWSWREPPPAPIADALRELCPDVSHLGTAESPMVLTALDTDVEPTHQLDPDATMFSSGAGIDLDLPVQGRVDELTRAHRADRAGSVGSDRAGTNERSGSPVPPRRAVRASRYRSMARPVADVPWSEVLLVPLDKRVAERDRVRVAVVAHKALIKQLDRDSPPLLTGAYPDGVPKPANRVALHVLDNSYPVQLPSGALSALAVLVPRGADPAEVEAVYWGVSELRSLHPRLGQRGSGGRSRELRVSGSVEVVAGDRLWREQAPGTVRLWRTSPPAVPDTRGYDGWSFTHAALLSLGFVWQGTAIAQQPGRGQVRDENLVDAVNAAGVAVLGTDPIRHSSVGDYVHRVHPDAVVRPYRATLSTGELGGPTTVQAIGQSRHLGGGLLVPDDHPEGSTFSGGADT